MNNTIVLLLRMKMTKTKLLFYRKKIMPNVKRNMVNYASVISIEVAIKLLLVQQTTLLN